MRKEGCFSYTCPRISEEEEKEERAALTEEEKQAIHDDMFGEDHEVEETEEMRRSGPLLLREALDCLPNEAKLDYLEALERYPRLVELESDPIAFLRCENYDAWVRTF